MNCKKYKKKFSKYLDKELDAEEQEHFEYHLANCEKCSRDFDKYKKIILLTNKLPLIEVSPNFDIALKSKLSNSETILVSKWVFIRRLSIIFSATCLLLILVLSYHLYSNSYNQRILTGKEYISTISKHSGKKIFANFVMPKILISKKHKFDSEYAESKTHFVIKNFALSLIKSKHSLNNRAKVDYVLRSVMLMNNTRNNGLSKFQ